MERPAGLSVWEARIFDRLASHLDAEVPLMSAYARLADESNSPYVKYLVDLILEDEARHHRLLTEFLHSVCLAVAPTPPGPHIPPPGRVDNADELLALTDRLIDFEGADLRSLRRLAREVRGVRNDTLWALIVGTMQRDTQKHLAILRFTRERVREARKH